MTPDEVKVTLLQGDRAARMVATVDGARAQFRAGDRYACKHVLMGAAVAVLCAAHPGVGIMCPSCVARHADRHSPIPERTCDECGEVVDLIYAGAVPVTEEGLQIRDPRGHRRPFAGQLLVMAVGLCRPCLAAVEAGAAG